MASDDNSANLPGGVDWPSRFRAAWLALLGRLGADPNSGGVMLINSRIADGIWGSDI
jgi:hypothetical protein